MKKTTGTASAGSILSVFMFLMLSMDIPELAINMPPIIEISVMRSGGMKLPARQPKMYILPCHTKSTPAARAMPMPYVDASTMDVTRSRVAFVKR